MKKIAILLGLSLLISMGMQAQKNKRTSAYMYNKNKQFDKAIEAIDEAIKHPKTEKDAKTWMYRGIIYYNVANDTSAAINALAPDAADISVEVGEKSASAKSLFKLQILGLTQGTLVNIKAEGSDEEKAVNTLVDLMATLV